MSRAIRSRLERLEGRGAGELVIVTAYGSETATDALRAERPGLTPRSADLVIAIRNYSRERDGRAL